MFASMDIWPLWINFAVFGVAAIVVWISGTRLAVIGDELAERLGLTREFIGLIFLATVTELPEVVTTLTAASAGNAALVLGNMFGGVTAQTAILAVADIFIVHRALTSWPRKPTHALEAVMLVTLLGVLMAITVVGDIELAIGVGIGAIVLSFSYPLVIALLRRFDERDSWAPIDLPEETELSRSVVLGKDVLAEVTTRRLITQSLGFSALILVAGVMLADRADAISTQTGLSSSFIGITFLAAATSLPELSTTFAAARIGAYTMAISNIFGSNLIMIALILPADLAYRSGPILAEVDASAQLGIATGIVVTAIYVAGILLRKTPRIFGAGLDSILVLTIYIGSLFALYFFA